jgi:dimethylargininase
MAGMGERIAVTRAVSPEIARCELTFLDREAIDTPRAVAQHEAYCAALEGVGRRVVRLPAPPGCPDGCFVEDAAIVVDEIAILTMMGAPSRRGESPGIEEALRPYRKVVRMELPATLDGGDVLRIGRRFFVGLSARSNPAGVAFLDRVLRPFGYEVSGVPLTGCLHLKSAATSLGGERALVNPAWIARASLPGVECLDVADHEPGAANVLATDGRVFVHQGYEATARRLEAEGFAVLTLDVSEFLKAEAGLTCKSLLFEVRGGADL